MGAAVTDIFLEKPPCLKRTCLFASALGFLHESVMTDLIAMSLLVMVIIMQKSFAFKR